MLFRGLNHLAHIKIYALSVSFFFTLKAVFFALLYYSFFTREGLLQVFGKFPSLFI